MAGKNWLAVFQKPLFRRTTSPLWASLFVILMSGCGRSNGCNEPSVLLQQASAKIAYTLSMLPDTSLLPRSMPSGDSLWRCTGIYDWTSGFWPGLLWYDAEYTGDSSLLRKAQLWTSRLEPVKQMPSKTHDLGFMLYCSFGNGYRQTHDSHYRDVLLRGADSLSSLFNPHVGTLLSWPWQAKYRGWKHNTIIDNMMNLELLFWASRNGRPGYADIALKHAETTLRNQVRPDYSTWHVVVYDSLTGKVDSLLTAQGYSNNSLWARGQAWAIYGFTMCYRESGKPEFLDAAKKLAARFLTSLPQDGVPYWDFDAPGPSQPKDASAAAIAASALFELSERCSDKSEKKKYFDQAVHITRSLGKNYAAPGTAEAILQHSVGNKPGNSEVDYSIIYADYYYFEALMRWKQLLTQHPELCK